MNYWDEIFAELHWQFFGQLYVTSCQPCQHCGVVKVSYIGKGPSWSWNRSETAHSFLWKNFASLQYDVLKYCWSWCFTNITSSSFLSSPHNTQSLKRYFEKPGFFYKTGTAVYLQIYGEVGSNTELVQCKSLWPLYCVLLSCFRNLSANKGCLKFSNQLHTLIPDSRCLQATAAY